MNQFSNIYLAELRELASKLRCSDIASYVLDNPRFAEWSASCHDYQHHYGDGGLIQHTYEVVDLALKNRDTLAAMGYSMPSPDFVYLAALFHDFGKIWDYERHGPTFDGPEGWRGTKHKRNIHHISRSAIEWSKAVDKYSHYRDIEDEITHAILAHHGQRAWGSPVAPKSRLAWLIHFCDCMSARMNDANKMDVVKHYGV